MKKILLIIICIFSIKVTSKTIIVSSHGSVTSIEQAAKIAIAGDSIVIESGFYPGGMYIENLKGTESKNITIIAESNGEAIIQGGANSIHFVDPEYLIIENLNFEQQTGNGLNMDDGGTYETPAHHVKFINCSFLNINAVGNNDLLKLSGVDNFEIIKCNFINGATGGSGIDMVGCHNGKILQNVFKNQGSNAIQAKGGSQYILIQQNYFDDCGQRTLNIGGSTGLEFFRPIDAKFEAADISVYSNIIIGSIAPICYVGSLRVDVTNNTIYSPLKWAIRILQETVDTSRFVPCSMGKFQNNLILISNVNPINIGPNTNSKQFIYKNNFWYYPANKNWIGPNTSTPDLTQIINQDPLFVDGYYKNYNLKSNSPAIGIIDFKQEPKYDFYGKEFASKRSAGAIEGASINNIENLLNNNSIIYPNPANDYIEISLSSAGGGRRYTELVEVGWTVDIYNIFGEKIPPSHFALQNATPQEGNLRIDISNLPTGVYIIKIGNKFEKFVKNK